MNKLNEKLAHIQTKFKAKKSRYNSFGKYYFRSAEDILEATKPYLLELGVYITVNEEIIELVSGLPVLKSTATISDGKDNAVTAIMNDSIVPTPTPFVNNASAIGIVPKISAYIGMPTIVASKTEKGLSSPIIF
jgi:hypothetical protein